MSPPKHCPSCHQKVPEGAFQCPSCELLLEGFVRELDPEPSQVGVVRALFERPQAASAPPEKPHDRAATRERPRASPPPLPDDVPMVVEGLELGRMRLAALEAMVVSACDGMASVEQLAEAFGVALEKMQRVLQGLVDAGLVTISERETTEVMPLPPIGADAAEVEEQLADEQTRRLDVVELRQKAEEQRQRFEERQRQKALGRAPVEEPPLEPEVRNALQQAIKMERAGRGVEALRFLELAISRSKDAAPLYNRLAIVLIRERLDFIRAEKMLARALELAPGNPVYAANLAQVRQRRAISTVPRASPPRRTR